MAVNEISLNIISKNQQIIKAGFKWPKTCLAVWNGICRFYPLSESEVNAFFQNFFSKHERSEIGRTPFPSDLGKNKINDWLQDAGKIPLLKISL